MKPVATFLLSSAGVAIIFWGAYGHDLSWDVYSGGVYWYSEEFSLRGKIIVSTAIGLLAGLILAAALWIFGRSKKNISHHNQSPGTS